MKQNQTLIVDKILNPQLYISIFGPHWCSQPKGSLKRKPFVNRDILVNEFSEIKKKSGFDDLQINKITQYALVFCSLRSPIMCRTNARGQ